VDSWFGRFFLLRLFIELLKLLDESSFFFLHHDYLLIEELFTLLDELDHVRVAGIVDGVEEWCDLAIQIEEATLLVAELHINKHF